MTSARSNDEPPDLLSEEIGWRGVAFSLTEEVLLRVLG